MTGQELDAKNKIMNAASRLFAQQGFEGTSTRDIAKLSGANLSLISYYFGGKEGLYKAVLSESALGFKEAVDLLIKEFDTEELNRAKFVLAIHSLIDSFFEMRAKNPFIFVIFKREKLAGAPHSKDIHEEIFKTIGDKIEGLIRRAQKNGFVSPDLKAQYFLTSLIETILGYFLHYDCCRYLAEEVFEMPEDRAEFKKQISLIFLEGIFR